MNTKIDFNNINEQLSPILFDTYLKIIKNPDYVVRRIFNHIKNNALGADELFVSNYETFSYWILEQTEQFSRLDNIILRHLILNKDFYENFEGVRNSDTLVNAMLYCFENKTKTLKVNLTQTNMIYLNFLRFLKTNKGQDLIMAKSSYDLAFDINYSYEDKPFYEQVAYKMEQIQKCKRLVVGKSSKNLIDNLMQRYIWDMMFENPSFAYKDIFSQIREHISDKTLSDAALYKRARKNHITLLQNLLKDNILEDYFDCSYVCEINGQVFSLRKAIESWLARAQMSETYKSRKKSISDYEILDKIEQMAATMNIRVKKAVNYCNAIVALKCNYLLSSKRHFDLYVYSGGGFKDFSTGQTGYYTDLLKLAGIS